MPADDYTPTTEQVRRAYVTGMRQAFIASAGEHSAEFDRWLAAHDARVRRDAAREVLKKRWVCQVARSGYHNGASCRPDDAHNDWGCDYYYEASIRATEHETGDQT